ncbi:smad nuclear-interacting protein 1 [Chanos chanos]|uniref:Smad nuclear-interacting protein 1 n=1 Tax=Chanos chanos TaxID=29144 RepID=A0A6J2VY76_CHACN|nr:smad nuclear-interacting protein 1 [Chanos chanos]
MDDRKRHKREESPARNVKMKIKQEKVSPDRPQRSRRSSSGSNRGSVSPARRRRGSRSPGRRRDRSPGKRDRSPGRRDNRSPRRRSRSPPHGADVKIKREQEDRRHRDRRDESNERRGKREEERPRQRERERDRGAERHRERSRERDAHTFQQQQAEREKHDERRRENRQRQEANGGHDNETYAFGSTEEEDNPAAEAEKEKPNFELSGALVEDTNTFRGVVIKYNEPPEARIPKRRWRLYPFKNDEPLPVMYIHRQSAYLLGRQRKIADIPIDHPSCSKQHAVFQYRLVEFTRADGTAGRRVKPYIIDLGSGNGTYLNNQRIEPQRYYELKEKDVLKFGFSSREYVLLHEFSDTAEVDARREEEDEDEGLDE